MVAVVTGNGFGLRNTSINTIGASGALGDSALGQGNNLATVNVANGNLILQAQDALLAGRGADLGAKRTYNSLAAPIDAPLDGWRWGYDQSVRFQGPGVPTNPATGAEILRTSGDGHESTFTWDAGRGAFLSTESGGGVPDELRYDAVAAEWVWTDGAHRMVERYSNSDAPDVTGRLIRCSDSAGNEIGLVYQGDLLTQIRDTGSAQELRLSYGSFNGLTRTQRLEARVLGDDADGRATASLGQPISLVDYDYDSQGRLSTVTRRLAPGGSNVGGSFVTTYEYDASNARITRIAENDGTGISILYDADGRVSAVKDESGAPDAQLAFAYGNPVPHTSVTDGNGQVWTVRYDDATSRLTELLTPAVGPSGLSTTYRYDPSGHLVGVTDPMGNSVTYGYDGSGNRAFECDAAGNTTTRTFGPLNRVLTESRYRAADPDGSGPQEAEGPVTTRYAYDAAGRTRFLVSPEGSVTENRYATHAEGYGLLRQTLLYIGQRFDVSGLSSTQQLTEAELEAWASALPDRAQVQLTDYTYDLRGNVSQRISYATVDAAGAGIRDDQASISESFFDAQSRLRKQATLRGSARDQRAVVSSFSFDGITRVIETNGINGPETTVYDDVNRRITVTRASGLVETRDYDDRGRLVSLTRDGDATTRRARFVYDKADRQRMSEDPDGGRRYRFYDPAGRLEFTVDATGAVTHFENNPAGQTERQTQFANRADSSTWYDAASNTVTKATLTLGVDVVPDPALDRVVSFAYDAAGRLATAVDAAGVTTTTTYDGLSRVVMTQTGARATRYFYDNDNRLTAIVDPRGYLTERKYDAGGRLVETVRYAGRCAPASSMGSPRWIGVAQQEVVAGQSFEFRVPAIGFDGDPLTLTSVGAAPVWLSLDSDRAMLRGTAPTAPGSVGVTLRADDGRGGVSDLPLLLTVVSAAPAMAGPDTGLNWDPLPPLDIDAGAAVGYVVPSAADPSAVYTLLGGLPSGLSFDPLTRTLSGSSSAIGFYGILFRAQNGAGAAAHRTLAVHVRASAPFAAQSFGSDRLDDWRPADADSLHSYLYYDGQGRVVGAVDEQQYLTETVYDEALNTRATLRYPIPVTVAASDTLASLRSRAGTPHPLSRIQFDDFGRVAETIGLDGSTKTRNEYDASGRQTRVVNAAGTAEERGGRTLYNAFGEIAGTLGGEGDAWAGTNPTSQRLTDAVRDYGIRYDYDTCGRVLRSTDANGNRTIYFYDREKRLSHAISVVGQSADHTLAGEVSETICNSFGQPLSVRRYATPLGHVEMDQLLARTSGLADPALLGMLTPLRDDARDEVRLTEYDRAGRVTRQVDAEGGFTESVYGPHGEIVAQRRSVRPGLVTIRQFDYDLAGRLVAETGDVGGINACLETGYDAFGRIVRSVDGAGRRTATAYPDNGRSIETTDALQRVTRRDYDAFGRVHRVTNALGQQTLYAFDDAARTVTATTPEGRQAVTAQTRHGETSSVTDGRGGVMRYAYNRDGRRVTMTDALAHLAAETEYDRSGRVVATTDARGTVTRFLYDQRNRVIERQVDPAGLNLRTLYSFDPLGRQVAVTEGAGSTAERRITYGYDRRGRATQVVVDATTAGLNLCTTTRYDDLDNAMSVSHGTASSPDQNVTLHIFDNLGRRIRDVSAPSAVFGAGAPGTRDLTTIYRYDGSGRLLRRIDANGNSTWQVYDAGGQVTHIVNALGEVAESRYDATGRVVYGKRYLTRLAPGVLATFGDVVGAMPLLSATANDPRSYTSFDGDGQPRFSLKAAGAEGWVIAENRPDANGNVIEVRVYDRFLPDAQVTAMDSAALPGISLAEIQAEILALGYQDSDPTSLAGVQRTFLAYDANNRRRFMVDPSGAVTETVYDRDGTTSAVVRFAVRPSLAAFDEAAIDAAVDRDAVGNRVTRQVYDAAGRLRYTVDALGSVSERRYDAHGNVVATLRWAGRPTVTQYTEAGVAAALAALAPANDQVTHLVYDAANRLRFTVEATGGVSENAYDAVGNATATTRFAQRPALTSFTDAALTAAVLPLRADPLNQVNRFAFDADRRLRFAVDALGSVTESTYDAAANLISTLSFAVRPTLAATDEAALMSAVAPLRTDPHNRATRYAYDAAGRLRFTVDALGSVNERTYDGAGNLAGTERFGARPILTQYSEAAIESAVAALRGQTGNRLENNLYDAQGRLRFNLRRLTLEAGQSRYRVTGQTLDAFGQTSSTVTYAAAIPLPSIDADAVAAAVGAGDPARDRLMRFVYDMSGRAIYRLQATSFDAGALKYRVSAQRFDALGQLTGSTETATLVAPAAFDRDTVEAALQAVSDPARDMTTALAYDALGQARFSLLALGAPGYQVSKQDFDALGRVVRTRQYATAVASLADFELATVLAAADGIASSDDPQTQYIYDAAGRQRFLLQADQAGSWTIAESRYDAFGNPAETRRYDRFLTDAWISTQDAARPLGLLEPDVAAELASLGYDEAAPATLAAVPRLHQAYDQQNRLRFTVDPLGGVTENVYRPFGELKTTVRYAARPALTLYTEPAISSAVDRGNRANRVQQLVYDQLGQLRFSLLVISPNADSVGQHRVTERRYDAHGQVIATLDYATPVGHLTAYEEEKVAAAIVLDPANDRSSAVAYDDGGRQAFAVRAVRVGAADQYIVSRLQSDALDQLVQRTDYAMPVTLTQFDLGSIATAVVAQPWLDRTTTNVRDAGGRLRFEIAPDLSFRETAYDAQARVIETRRFDFAAPDNTPRTESEAASLRGNRAVGDGSTRGQVQVWDAAGRLASVVDALGHAERYVVDALGLRRQWTDKNGSVFACSYDRRGRKTSETTPLLQFKLRGESPATPAPDRAIETRFAYDAFGNLVRKIDAANFATDAATTDFTFDLAGRPTGSLFGAYYDEATRTVEPSAGPGRFRLEASVDYDVMGNPVRAGTRSGVNAFQYSWRTYDSLGQVVHELNTLNHVTRYVFNTFGERQWVMRFSVTIQGTPANGVYWSPDELDPQLNNGLDELGNIIPDTECRMILLAYDKLGRKSQVTMPTADYYSTHTPGDASQANYFRETPASVTPVQDAAVTRYEYDVFGGLTLQRVRANTIVEWQDARFSYDRMGRCVQSIDAAGNVTSMSFDLLGNLVWRNEASGQPDGTDRVAGYAYNLLDQQVRVDRYGLRYSDADGTEHGVATWTWANGGEWLDPDADTPTTVRTASYDAYGRPLNITDAAGNLTSIHYDALGHVIRIEAPERIISPIAANNDLSLEPLHERIEDRTRVAERIIGPVITFDSAVDPFRNQITRRLVTTMTLDVAGRAVRQLRATSSGEDVRETLQTFDAVGNLVRAVDAEGNAKQRSFDHAGRVIRETQAISSNLGALGINNQGLERRYHYDALGQLTDTLDVYVDEGALVQSGKGVAYNPFGEVIEERRKWGPANQAPDQLNSALVTWNHYDNAGHVFEKLAADRLTLYFYNLLGQVTREEKRGNSADNDGTGKRITEIQYDVLGRSILVRRPAFDADVTAGSGTTIRLVTPYAKRSLDRWGNVRGTEEGGYQVVNGQPAYAPIRLFRSYAYDDNDKVVGQYFGTHGVVPETGGYYNAQISKLFRRDLMGNVVQEIDEARDPQADTLIRSRIRRKQYDAVGHLIADIDGTNRKVEYAWNIHGERLGTRNARGTVFFERRDRNGNTRFQGVLRTSSNAGPGEYNSFTGAGTISRTYLHAYQYDQAGRRFASKTFTEGANAPWSYTWLDGRNFGVKQSDVMGLVTQRRFDPFGNKSLEVDSGGARKVWNASTADYTVGRIETYQLPGNNLIKFGFYRYNDYGELTSDELSNTRIQYERHKNGLVLRTIVKTDVTQNNAAPETTTYQYDVRGQVTMEGRIDATSIQTKMISYDNQGRLSRVEDNNKVPFSPMSEVRYDYDEWSNVRRIQAVFTPTPTSTQITRDSWYAYDSAGRMTVANGALVSGSIRPKPLTSGSVRIGYDAVGRRSGTTEYVRHNSVQLPSKLRTWDTMRDESYEYNDLGHLHVIQQRVRHVDIVETPLQGDFDPESKPDRIGPWRSLSTRSTNLRGDVTTARQWTRISGSFTDNLLNQTPTELGTTTTTYRADGQVNRTRYDAIDPKKSTDTQNTYNSFSGQLDSYTFHAFRTDGVPFQTTFTYSHTFQNGERTIGRISDSGNGLNTYKTYDPLGRLSTDRVDLPRPNGSGSDRYEERRYKYAADRRAIFKSAELRLSANGPNTVPLQPPTTGQQSYVYAGNRMVGTVGGDRLANGTQFAFAYTPMSESSGSGAGRYVVQNGDSLVDIALANYGDAALWYVIADANGIAADPGEPLPSTEFGKSYEVPDVVRSTLSASTVDSWGFGEIVGNDRPITIPAPPPPHHSDLEMLAVAVASITVQVVATVGLSALGVPAPVSAAIGAGLGNLTSQATAWELGMQKDIDWGNVGIATVEGYLFSVAGSAGALSREVWQQAKGGFDGWTSGSGPNWSGIAGSLFNVGFDALGPTLGGPKVGQFNFGLAGLINSAYNPSSGWAIPGSGKSPTLGAFEYAYGAVANGLASTAFTWMREQLDRPTAPKAPEPRSVDDPRGPISAETLDMWDDIDRQYIKELDEAEQLARNQKIAAESDERLRWQLKIDALQDRIDHFGESIDDRALIEIARRKNDAERAQAAALARANAAARAAKLRANTLRMQAEMAKGPDPALLQYVQDMDELNNQIVRDMYAEGTFVRVSDGVNIDGLKLERVSGVYDTMGMYNSRNSMIDAEIERYKQYQKADPSLEGLEIIVMEDMVTPAEQARRLGLANVKTFEQFSKQFAKQNGGSLEGVQKAFLAYHDQQSKEITAAWDRIDRAAGAVNLIAKGTFLGVQFIFDPAGTVVPLLVENGSEKVLKAAGVDEQTASMIGGLMGIASGGAVGYAQITRGAHGSVQDLLRAERAARAEFDTARLAAQAAEFEMSKGVQVAEGVTLFKGVPQAARDARIAGSAVVSGTPTAAAPLVLAGEASAGSTALRLAGDAPSGTTALQLAGDVPSSSGALALGNDARMAGGGVPAIPGRDFHAPASMNGVTPYEATGPSRLADNALGGFEPQPRGIANITSGAPGEVGGAVQVPPIPAVMYGRRLVTVYEGQAYYRSLGESVSHLPGMAEPFVKRPGAFYQTLGIQEVGFTTPNLNINRGWVIKGLDEAGNNLGAAIPQAPALEGAAFDIQGYFNQPELVNQWLGQNGYVPWIDVRHVFGNGDSIGMIPF